MDSEPSDPTTRATSSYRRCISASVGAGVLTFFFVPMFLYPMGSKSHYSFEGTILALVAGLLGAYGFLGCPRRPISLKLATSIICICSVAIAIFAVLQYIRFGRSS